MDYKHLICSLLGGTGLHEAAAVLKNATIKREEDRLAEYIVRLQTRSTEHPELDGAFFRAWDFSKWEVWASGILFSLSRLGSLWLSGCLSGSLALCLCLSLSVSLSLGLSLAPSPPPSPPPVSPLSPHTVLLQAACHILRLHRYG